MIERRMSASAIGAFVARFEPNSVPEASNADLTLPFRFVMELATYRATVAVSDRSMLTTSADGAQALVLSGDIVQPQAADVGAALLDLYARRGLDFITDLNGAFRLLVLDRQAGTIAIATDRTNSYKLLADWNNGTWIVSTALNLQPLRGAQLDRTAIAEYMATGYIFNDLTPYERVRILDSGSIYRLEDGRIAQRQYWRFAYQTPSSASPQSLKHELGDLIIEATRRRIPSDRPIYLSLSGGYDSSAIAAVLSSVLHVENVQCFTYAHGEVQPGSEEAVAAQTAALFGYPCQIVPAFDGDVAQMIRRNGHLGGGMTRPCDEVDAWVRMGQQVENGPIPVVFTGDTLFLKGDWRLRSVKDVLTATRLYNFSVLSWLKPLLGLDVYQGFVAATQHEIDRAIERTPRPADSEDALDWRDMLRFDQISSRMTAIWREYFVAPFFEPTHPLLDNDILDFLVHLPGDLRRGKSLYIAAVTEMFPTLFAQPRASFASYPAYWPEALAQQSIALQTLIREQASPLDDVFPPEILLALLTADRPALTRSNARLGNVLKYLYRLLRRANLHQLPVGRPSLYTPTVGADIFLKRALVMRSFLAEMQVINETPPHADA